LKWLFELIIYVNTQKEKLNILEESGTIYSIFPGVVIDLVIS